MLNGNTDAVSGTCKPVSVPRYIRIYILRLEKSYFNFLWIFKSAFMFINLVSVLKILGILFRLVWLQSVSNKNVEFLLMKPIPTFVIKTTLTWVIFAEYLIMIDVWTDENWIQFTRTANIKTTLQRDMDFYEISTRNG